MDGEAWARGITLLLWGAVIVAGIIGGIVVGVVIVVSSR